MAETIVDSSIVIDYLRGDAKAAEFLETLRETRSLATHVVVVAEVLTGARDQREQKAIERLLAEFQIIAPDETDFRRSIDLLKRHRLSHGVGWLDCLIGATCLARRLAIATLNEKHFAVFSDLNVQRPY